MCCLWWYELVVVRFCVVELLRMYVSAAAHVATQVHLMDERHQELLCDPLWDDSQDEFWQC